MSDFEHDDELRNALRRAQPARNEAAPVLRANRARMARARARRRAVVGSITAVSFAVVGAALFAANGTDDTNVVDVVAPPSTSVAVSSTVPDDSISATSLPPLSTVTTIRGVDQSTTAPSGPSTTAAQSSTTAPTTTAATRRQTFTSRGGTVTVNWASVITVEQITDEAGWVHTMQYKGDDVEVEWRRSNPDDDTKIRLRLENGEIRQEID